MQIPFFDFSRETAETGPAMHAALEKVMSSGTFILGPEVRAFEQDFARFCGCDHAVGVASGTDALFLALKAAGIGPGDEVITVANTFAATVLAIMYTGATPVLVDIERSSHLMDPALLEQAVTDRTRAIIPVHLYGMCADMDGIMELARAKGLFVLEDACQAHGALYKGRPAGSLGHAAAFSFYPTKNLGAYGDGGMITTGDPGLHEKLLLLRNYGQKDRYHHQATGYNSRLDELQAAFLRAKLPLLMTWVGKRRQAAQIYAAGLEGIDRVNAVLAPGSTHAYYLYVVSVNNRDCLQKHLADKGVGTLIHYPVPIHRQPAFAQATVSGGLPNTGERVQQILSLPMHPWLREDELAFVVEAIQEFYE